MSTSMLLSRRAAASLVALAFVLLDGTALPGQSLVKDINTTPGLFNPDSSPNDFAVLGSVAYFRAKRENIGTELWRTDDGEAWDRAGDVPVPGATVNALAANSEGYEAVARSEFESSLWVSADAETWVPAAMPSGVDPGLRLVGGDAGFYVPFHLQPAPADPSHGVVGSADGRVWTVVAEPDTFGPGFNVDALAYGSDRLVVLGRRIGPGFDEAPPLAVWVGAAAAG